jgi:peptide chain release factor 2
MENLIKQLNQLNTQISAALLKLNVPKLQEEVNNLTEQTLKPNFWENQTEAQALTKKIAKINNRLEPWLTINRQVIEALELAKIADADMADDLNKQLAALQASFDALKHELEYGGPYDDHDVILSIFAGAGGTDAQDWAQMLLRMYTRWVEAQNGWQIKIIEQSVGEEAGIKSVTAEIVGPFAYGKLKSEQGVHRLVRLSPFNADHLRQTSFARVDIMPKIDQPELLEINEKDLKIDVYRAGGHGGQSVNTTDSAVRVTHLPTGITVAIQNERSQLQNKETAMTILRSRLVQLQLEQHQEKIEELKGPNEQAAWGNQIRNYVLHPYNLVKDLRSNYEASDTQAVLAGHIDDFIKAYLEWQVAAE